MAELKPISLQGVPGALAKAERYRLLNEPWEAESICRDILAVDPGHEQALVVLLLALTDQFHGMLVTADDARELLPRLTDAYQREYYAGVIGERWAKALLETGYGAEAVLDELRAAMSAYERAQQLAPPGNDDAILRWNACVRLVDRHGLRGLPARRGGPGAAGGSSSGSGPAAQRGPGDDDDGGPAP